MQAEQMIGPGATSTHEAGKRRVFSGIQPSGSVQLGNYLGAIKGWVQRQSEKENFFCIVDLHAITVPQDPEELRSQTRSLAAILLAAGLDPSQCTVFIQSHVAAHAEACWLLNCVTPIGWLERMTQYKDKVAGQESVPTGLLDYPVLMAADILLYDAHEVPVGDDQKQHVELARDIAQRFNHLYGETFVVPEPVIAQVGARVMGLDNPLVKMSKSFAHVRGHAVGLLDDPREIERSFKRAKTDSGNEIHFSEKAEKARALGVDVDFFQSNHEGAIIDHIQESADTASGIIINPGALTTYGLSLRDALADTRLPAIEVHLSNIHARERFRRRSVLAPIVISQIAGLGWRGYLFALESLVAHIQESRGQ